MAAITLSPSKSSVVIMTVKPSPSKRKKVDEDDPEDVIVKEEPVEKHYSERDDEIRENDSDSDSNEINVRRKVPVQLRVDDIFHMATLGETHRPSKKDFLAGNADFPRETDPTVLSRRWKQIEYGKSTLDYKQYTEAIPRDDRLEHHPRTPNVNRKYSRRAWDGLIRLWRCSLHLWDQDPQVAASERYLHLQRRRQRVESRSSTGESTSTTSSMLGESEACFFSEAEDIDTSVSELKVKVEDYKPLASPTPPVNRSWYEETIEFEEEYPELCGPKDEFEFKVKPEPDDTH